MASSLLSVIALATTQPKVIDLRHASSADRVAVLTCSGLANRAGSTAQPAFTLLSDEDEQWLADIDNITDPVLTQIDTFIADCLRTIAHGIVLYNGTLQQALIPNVITVAAVLDAVPLQSLPKTGAPVVFNASHSWSGYTALDATRWVYEHHVNATTGLAKTNPGLLVHDHPWSLHPPLGAPPTWGLTDFIVKNKLFNFFLANGCLPGTDEHAFMLRMLTSNPWAHPIAVWGYDDTHPIAGDPFEAETTCVEGAPVGMGQIASNGVNNLAYFSRTPPIDEPIAQPPPPPIPTYNASTTYVSLIIGDGDNLAFVKGSRRAWFLDRSKRCAPPATPTGECMPLAWTMSPHTLYAAPGLFEWYAARARATGRDWLILPPSGHLYAYPSLLPPADQATFVALTERDCWLMNTSGSVTWEMVGTWPAAIEHFYPRYVSRGITRGLFAVQVPYMLPVLAFGRDEQYKLLGMGDASTVAIFRPREWRGGSGAGSFERTAKQMASELSNAPRGSVIAIYTTSDGGFKPQLLYDMVSLLAPHVEVVDTEALVAMAVERG